MKYKIRDVISSKITGQWGNECQEGEQGSLVLGISNLKTDGSFDFSKVAVRSLKGKKLYESLLKNGDILIAKSGNPKVCYFNGPESTYFACNFILTIRPKIDVILNKFLYYSILFIYKTEIIKNCYTSTTIPNLNINSFLDLSIEVPSMSKQRKIIDELSKIDEILPKLDKQLSLFDELVKARFIESFDTGKYPKKSVEELCSEIVDCPHTTPKYEGELKNPAIRTSEIKKGYITWDSMRYVSDEEYEERIARLRPEAGDIVYGREGTFGNAAILPKGYKFCLGQRVMLLRPDYSLCTSEYLLHAVISDDVYRQAESKNNASTVAHVNVKDVKNFVIPLPPIDLQSRFAEFIIQVEKSKNAVEKSMAEIQKLFDSLMQQYFG